MNVIAKSTNLSPFLRATATVVSNGGMPVAATGKVTKAKVTVPESFRRRLQQTVYQDLLTGPTYISSGVAGASALSAYSTPRIFREFVFFYNKSRRYSRYSRLYNRYAKSHTLQIAALSIELRPRCTNVILALSETCICLYPSF